MAALRVHMLARFCALCAAVPLLGSACGPSEEAGSPAEEAAGSDIGGEAQWSKTTAAGLYRVSLRPRDEVLIPLARLHAWVVHVETPDGAPFDPIRLAFSGGMPQHGHGFVTQPRVTRALGNGDFLVEGVKFHMGGEWTLRVELVGPAGPDVAVFTVLVGSRSRSAATLWSDAELALLRSLSLASLPELRPSASNRVASDERAARLGHRLFFDPGLSANGQISCASCHVPALHFTDGAATSTGLGTGARNAPSVVGAAYSPWQFWDGRRDSLWAQALAPLEASVEMGNDRLRVVRTVTTGPRYRADYAALFGLPPDFADTARFPERASPVGDDEARRAWAALSAEARDEIDRAFANVGKAIEAYERKLLPGASRFDRYVEGLGSGDAGAAQILSDDEVAGLRLFVDAGRTLCLRCHNGPLLTNQSFHDVATSRLASSASPGTIPDLGRFVGVQALLRDPFNCAGRFSDAPPEACDELRFLDKREIAVLSGAFKTPGLREVARTGPYFHDGSAATLEEVIEHYRRPPDDPGSEITPLELSDRESGQLAAFLGALSGGVAGDPRWVAVPRPDSERDAEPEAAF